MSDIDQIQRTKTALMAAESEGFEHTAQALHAELVRLTTTSSQTKIGAHKFQDEAEAEYVRLG